MTMRYYICPVVGSGKRDDPYRAKAADHGLPHVAVIPSLPDGSPEHAWCLSTVDATDHTPLLSDAELTALPELKHADAWLSARSEDREVVMTKAASLGITIASDQDFGRVLRQIGLKLDPGFDENANWVRSQPQ